MTRQHFPKKNYYKVIMTLLMIGVLFLSMGVSTIPAETVIVPNFAKEYPRAQDFQVTAEGKELPVLEGTIAAMSYAIIKGKCTVTVVRDKSFKKVVVRPLSAGIKPKIIGNKVIFSIPKAMNLSIEFDDDIKRPLFLFTSPERENVPSKDDPNVRYYEAGKIYDAREIRLYDNETLYLEPGAIVQGYVTADNVNNIRILGSGILDQSARKTLKVNSILLTECENVLIQDVQIHDAWGWTLHPRGCDNVIIDNHKQTGWRANCDGIDIEASHNVEVKNSFIRSSDDCIAIKSKQPDIVRRRGSPKVDSVLIENTVLWNAIGGNALEVGFELKGDYVQNITFRDCDVIRVERGAALSIHNAEDTTVRNVTFENVRVEDARDELIDLYIGLSIYSVDIPAKYSRRFGFNIPDSLKDPDANDNRSQWLYLPQSERSSYSKNRGQIENVIFKDIQVVSEKVIPSLIKGWDDDYSVDGVVIENLTFGGKRMRSLEEAKIAIENATNTVIK
ncbi:glycosyl hydrolase family 28 protein [Zobellia roscoffensis]|uniref:glycosyl hydrolase family 28 protein n=1 Tax=Zobellia roscoffensis TaxID=2779508 RepID=UPI00188AC82E|nr:glycosyl hydrolase family 28 protein [Zobellia roscoffensis]